MRACTKQSVIKDKRIRREKMSGFRSRQCLESSQNATALAAATFKESTPCAIGIMTRVVTAIDRGGGETVALGSEDHCELFF